MYIVVFLNGAYVLLAVGSLFSNFMIYFLTTILDTSPRASCSLD